ncbi:MAG: hypothetical protein WCQ26_11795 [Pseudanabaena sp. ELA748]
MNLKQVACLTGLILLVSPASLTFAQTMKSDNFISNEAKVKGERDKDRDNDWNRGNDWKRNDDPKNPDMLAALRDLRQAKRELESAPHRYGGKRAAALEKTKEAIRLVEEALRDARR